MSDAQSPRRRRCLGRHTGCRRSSGLVQSLVVAGGVAANTALRQRLETIADAAGLPLLAPPGRLCTDNAAMIAWAGLERLRLGESSPLDFAPRPRWPLDQGAPSLGGAGVKA